MFFKPIQLRLLLKSYRSHFEVSLQLTIGTSISLVSLPPLDYVPVTIQIVRRIPLHKVVKVGKHTTPPIFLHPFCEVRVSLFEGLFFFNSLMLVVGCEQRGDAKINIRSRVGHQVL